jgi:hypothetical protein
MTKLKSVDQMSAEELKAVSISAEEFEALRGAEKPIRKPVRKAKSKSKFTILPDAWRDRLEELDADGTTYRVAIHLLREAWRSGSDRVKLANVALEGQHVSRWSKYRALNLLREAGLISVKQEPRKSPVVKVRFQD